ncbi:very long chain fatty acid elongase 7-like [Bacillus rossius redtenbacheri]|uniref:very long chain fatty acid elongase 7-like n=1 Tax=Bacillus rossius redtenbacheri TaxID=93214 RepID=UPI002FDD637F
MGRRTAVIERTPHDEGPRDAGRGHARLISPPLVVGLRAAQSRPARAVDGDPASPRHCPRDLEEGLSRSLDPRTKDWLFLSSPWHVVAIVALYLYFCLRLGPRLMRDRQPFDVDRFIVAYDLFQILISAWLSWQGVFYGFPRHIRFFCEPVDYSTDEVNLHIASMTWLYFMVKVLDLLDTVFFVLRKKDNQVTFLHVYHHAMMVLGTWAAAKYFAGGHFLFLGQMNSIVHTVMYSYYLLANIHPAYKKSLWWKKYITQLQIAQFLLLCVQNYPTFLWSDCAVSVWLRLFLSAQNLLMLVMFLDFYKRAYRRTKSEA